MFEPASASTQTMVVRTGELIPLKAGSSVTEELDVACAQMHLDGPGSSDSFSLKVDVSLSDLIDLLELADFSQEDFRVQQFAIWTITDNPGRIAYVGLGSFGTGSGPSDEELNRIYTLFSKAGIDSYHR